MKSNVQTFVIKYFYLRKWFLYALWLIFILSSMFWNFHSCDEHILNNAQIQARTIYSKDNSLRLWASKQGGVYVPISDLTPPNENLAHIPNRDIVTPAGDSLTLMNPDYLLRQTQDFFSKEFGIPSGMTSLKPLNPINTPDAWETKGLKSFEQGKMEIIELSEINGNQYLRLMKPLFTEKKCIECHTDYKIGEIRGAIGTSVPLEPHFVIANKHKIKIAWFHFLIFLFGISGAQLFYRFLERSFKAKGIADKALETSETKFKALVENMTDFVFVVNPEFKVETINVAAQKFLGISEEEIIGKKISNLFPENIAKGFETVLQNVFETGNSFNSQKVMPRFDAEITITTQLNAIRDKKDKIIAVMGVGRDISDQKEAEERLLKSEEKFRTLADFTYDWEYWTDPDEKFVYVSPSCERITGYKPSYFYANPSMMMDIIHPDDRDLVLKHHDSFDSSESHNPIEFRIITKSGEERWIGHRCQSVLDDNGKDLGRRGSNRDITIRKVAELALKDSEERISTLLNATKDIVWLLSPEGVFLAVNDSAAKSLERTKQELIGKTIFDFVNSETQAKRKVIYDEIHKSKKPLFWQEKFDTKHGTRYSDNSVYPILDENGDIKQIAVYIKDITSIRHTEKTLRETKERLLYLLKSSSAIIYTCDVKNNFASTSVSENVEDILGYTVDEFQAYPDFWADHIHPEDKTRIFEGLADILETKKHNHEYRFQHKDGSYRCLADDLRVVCDEKDEPVEMIGTITDITEKTEIALALKQEMQKAANYLNISPVMIIALDRDARLTLINDAGCRVSGYSRAEVIGEKWIDLVTPLGNESPLKKAYPDLMNNGLDIWSTADREFITKSREIKTIRWHNILLTDENGKKLGILCSGQDITNRIKGQKALKDSEERFRTIFENSPVLIDAFDENGKVVFWNRECEKVFGWTKQELQAHENPLALFYPDPLVRQDVLKAGTTDPKQYYREWNPITKDGKKLTTLWTNYRLEDGLVFNLGHDITARKIAEEKLLRRENYLSALNEAKELLLTTKTNNVYQEFVEILGKVSHASRTYIFINHKNANGQLLMSQRAEYVTHGIKPEKNNPKLQNLSYDDFFPRWEKTLAKGIIVSGKVADFPKVEKEFLEAQEIQSVLIIPIFFDSQFIGFIGFDNCVSEKEWDDAEKNFLGMASNALGQYLSKFKAQEQIIAEYSRFRTTMDAINSIVYVSDIETFELLFLNKHGRDIFGDSIGKKCYSVLQKGRTTPCDFCTNHLLLDKNGHPNKTHVWEFQNTITKQWYQLSDQAIRWPDGRFVRLEIATDITFHKKAGEDKIAMEKKIMHTQKLESLGILAGGIAHDFNNILTAILGNADLGLMNISDYSPVKTNLTSIKQATHHAAALAKQMLAYSGKGHFIVKSISLSELIEEMTHVLSVSISKKIVIHKDFAANIPPVLADISQIRQIIMNLITNASEAIGDRSGIITIRTGVRFCDEDYLKNGVIGINLTEKMYSYFEIIDTGCGMTKETQNKIFDPFFSTKFTGRGLGMAAVLGIVRGHQGEIIIYSEIDKGTKVKVLFPSTKLEIENVSESTKNAKQVKLSGTILLVDDEESVRTVAGEILRRLGFTVLIAENGQEGFEMFKKNQKQIKIVILDYMMPIMDGLQTLETIRELDNNVPVIISSGYSEHNLSKHFKGLNLSGFMQKPFEIKNLRKLLQKTIKNLY